jgi:ATP-dependent protease ClpP protease subunit
MRAARLQQCCDFFNGLKDEEFFGDKVQHAYLYDAVDTASVVALKNDILNMNRSVERPEGGTAAPKPIVVHVNSLGGDVHDGLSMRTIFRESRVPICVLVDGVSCSAATFISIFAPYRVMCEYSTSLIHEFSVETHGSIKRRERLFQNAVLEEAFKEIRQAYISHTRMSAAKVDQLLKRDLYLSADSCHKHGICDRVIRPHWSGYEQYIQRNPQYRLGYATLLKKTNLNTVRFDCEGVYNLTDVLMLDHLLQSDSSLVPFLKPVIIKIDNDSCMTFILSQTMPILHRIQALRIPSIAVVSTIVSLEDFLPALFCSRRVIYEHAKVYINVLQPGRCPASLLQDMIDNGKYMFKLLQTVLRKRTRLPDAMIKSIERERILLSAQDCKKFGLVDEVIKL